MAKRAEEMKAKLPEGTIDGSVLDIILDIENGGPGDIIQAKQLAIVSRVRKVIRVALSS